MSRCLHARGLADTSASRVWCFVGDGEFDEPETTGALGMAGREHLDNLVFVVNCNLQRLDGPVRGNGKVIQEFEALFRGAGWNVIKVIWGRTWDDLLAKDVEGVLLNKMNSTVDGEFQKYATESGAYIREHFFGPDPRPTELQSADLSDEALQSAPRGGHDYRKLYAAYKAATEHEGGPTVVLAKTIKGWTLGPEIEARNATHQIKKMTKPQLLALRDRLFLHDEIPEHAALDADLPPYYRPGPRLPGRPLPGRAPSLPRRASFPLRVVRPKPLDPPGRVGLRRPSSKRRLRTQSSRLDHHGLRPAILRNLGPRSVGRVAGGPHRVRARPGPSGLESLIATKCRSTPPDGQSYTPVDAGPGPPLRGGRDRPRSPRGGHHRVRGGDRHLHLPPPPPTPPGAKAAHPLLHLFYSMFGFQRVGDLLWALGDCRGRGFLLGCTAGRTTLNGEGLQHQDGHSLLLASTVPSVAAYDPAFSYEVATIVEDGIRRMTGPDPEDRIWYITLYNENYPMPALPAEARPRRSGCASGPSRDACTGSPTTPWSETCRRRTPTGTGEASRPSPSQPSASLSGSSWQAAMREARTAAGTATGASTPMPVVGDLLQVAAGGTALSAERWNRLHPRPRPRRCPLFVLAGSLVHLGGGGPVVAVTDFVRAVPDQISRFVPRHFTSLGTDGFGRSDTRDTLRRFFEVDAAHIVVAVLDGAWWPSGAGAQPRRRLRGHPPVRDRRRGPGDPWTRLSRTGSPGALRWLRPGRRQGTVPASPRCRDRRRGPPGSWRPTTGRRTSGPGSCGVPRVVQHPGRRRPVGDDPSGLEDGLLPGTDTLAIAADRSGVGPRPRCPGPRIPITLGHPRPPVGPEPWPETAPTSIRVECGQPGPVPGASCRSPCVGLR